MPVAGVEPARCFQQRILSPSRLPIPTHRLSKKHYNRAPVKKQHQPMEIYLVVAGALGHYFKNSAKEKNKKIEKILC